MKDIRFIPGLPHRKYNMKNITTPRTEKAILIVEPIKSIVDPFEMPHIANVINPDKECGYLAGSYSFHQNEPWIQTYSKRRINPFKVIPDAIVIQDAAHALSLICRYNGACNEFYSVAQHSVIVSYLCDQKYALHGLLHDLSEYVLGDVCSPIKRSDDFEKYREIEYRFMKAVYNRFELSGEEPENVKRADKLAFATEVASGILDAREDFIIDIEPAPFSIVPLSPKQSKELFLNRFFDLINRPDIKKKYHSGLDKLDNQQIREALFK